jgi:hypothetical protein
MALGYSILFMRSVERIGTVSLIEGKSGKSIISFLMGLERHSELFGCDVSS